MTIGGDSVTDADTIRWALNMGDGLGDRVQDEYMTPARAALAAVPPPQDERERA